MKVIYVAHPYSKNPKENIADAREIICKLHKQNPENWYTTTLGEFVEETPYEDVMAHCFERILRCDAIMFYPDYQERDWQESKGCRLEYSFAKQHGIEILHGK